MVTSVRSVSLFRRSSKRRNKKTPPRSFSKKDSARLNALRGNGEVEVASDINAHQFIARGITSKNHNDRMNAYAHDGKSQTKIPYAHRKS